MFLTSYNISGVSGENPARLFKSGNKSPENMGNNL